jgi:hypothetical protein
MPPDIETVEHVTSENQGKATQANPVTMAEKYGISVYESNLGAGINGGLFKDNDKIKLIINKNMDLNQKRSAINRGIGIYLLNINNRITDPIIDFADASRKDIKANEATSKEFIVKHRNAKPVTPEEVGPRPRTVAERIELDSFTLERESSNDPKRMEWTAKRRPEIKTILWHRAVDRTAD